MSSFYKASTYAKDVEETLVSQRPTPTNKGPTKVEVQLESDVNKNSNRAPREELSVESPKDYSISKWNAQATSRMCDAVTYDNNRRLTAKKRATRLSIRGRRKQLSTIPEDHPVENQSLEDLKSRNESNLAAAKDMMSKVVSHRANEERIEKAAEGGIDEEALISAICANGNPVAGKLVNLLLIQMSFIASLCVAETLSQYAAATAQMLAGVLGSSGITLDFAKSLVDCWWVNPEEEKGNPIENQAWVEEIRTKLIRVRDGVMSYDSIPVWKQLSRCFVLASMVGLMPPTKTDSEDLIQQALSRWSRRVEKESFSTSFAEIVLSSAIFACDAVNAVMAGCVRSLFSPDDVQQKAAELIALENTYKNGMLLDIGETPGGYQTRISQTLDEIKVILKSAEHGVARIVFVNLQKDLTRILHIVNGSMRNISPREPAPIIAFIGDSHVGKTGFIYMTANALGRNFGFPTEDKNFYYSREGDAYDSGFTGEKTVMVEDDRDALKEKFITAATAANDLAHCNTVPYQSVQADIAGKGCIPYLHKVKFVTSNCRHLGILNTMAEPKAGFNRNWIFEIQVKPEYQDADGRIDPLKTGGSEHLDPEVHQIRRVFWEPQNAVTNDAGKKSFKTIKSVTDGWRERHGHWMSTPEFLHHVIELYDRKMNGCGQYLKQINKLRETTVCKQCRLFEAPGYCQCVKEIPAETEIENQAGFLFPNGLDLLAVQYQWFAWAVSMVPDWSTWENAIGANIFLSVTDRLGALLVKAVILGTYVCTKHFMLALYLGIFKLGWLCLLFDHRPRLGRIIIWLWFLFTYLFSVRLKRVFARACIREINRGGSNGARLALKVTTVGVATSAIVYSLYSLRGLLVVNQGNLQPQSMEDIEERNAEKNPWLVAKAKPLPRNDRIATMTHQQVLDVVSENIVQFKYSTEDNKLGRSCALFICNNTMIVPTHCLERISRKDPIEISRNDAVGGVFNGVYISSVEPMEPDFSLVVITSAPSFKDIRHFIVDKIYEGRSAATMVSRNEDMALEIRTLMYNHEIVANESYRGPGSKHRVNRPTRKGLCASPVFLQSCPSKIIGLHCGGSTVTPDIAVCFSISLEMVEAALMRLATARNENQSFVGDMPMISEPPKLTVCNTPIGRFEEKFHERDCVNWTYPPDEDRPHKIEVFTTLINGKFKRFSEVMTSPLSRYLEQSGRPQLWGPPKFNVNKNFSAAYQKAQKPCRDVIPSLLSYAVNDYIKPVIEKFRALKMRCRPLDMEAAINGKPGSRFVKRMDMSTASGIGLSSPKSKHFDVKFEENGSPTYTMKDYLEQEVEELHNVYRSGKVPSCIFKTALKDEPTKLTKDKVRVFMVSPIALNILFRMYLLPIMECLFFIPLVCEMAQGINCTNEEWHDLGKWLHDWNPTQCIAGDFSNFDIGTPGQFTRAVGWIFRQFALVLGYLEEEAMIVELLFYTIASKFIIWNGTVIHIDSYTLSGVPVTIFLNGVVNALYHRLVFYHYIFANDVKKISYCYQEYIRTLFVGDDVIGSSKLEWFNMETIQRVLKIFNLVYTDAEKNLDTRKWYTFEDIVFCKRKFRFEPLVGFYVAPLDLESIYKSLHCQMLSTTSALDVITGNVGNALRELARHGDAVFDEEKSIIKSACEAAGFAHLVREMDYDFHEWWNKLRADFITLRPENLDFVSTPSDSTGSVDTTES